MKFRYDFIIVGSSPILLAHALKLSGQGFSVALIEKENSLGGAWDLINIPHFGDIESACHIIEWYRGGYERLEELTGIKFEKLQPAAIKVYSNGSSSPYDSRIKIIDSFLQAVLTVFVGVFRIIFPGRYTRLKRFEYLQSALSALFFVIKYRLPGIFMFDGVRAPVGGYSNLIKGMVENVENSSVKVIKERVKSIKVFKNYAQLKSEKNIYIAEKVILGESTVLSEGSFFAQPLNSSLVSPNNFHLLISVDQPRSEIDYSYIHLPDNPIFHRITSVNYSRKPSLGASLFLVQLRHSPEQFNSIEDALHTLFVFLKIISPGQNVKIEKVLKRAYPFAKFAISDSRYKNRIDVLATKDDLSKSVLKIRL